MVEQNKVLILFYKFLRHVFSYVYYLESETTEFCLKIICHWDKIKFYVPITQNTFSKTKDKEKNIYNRNSSKLAFSHDPQLKWLQVSEFQVLEFKWLYQLSDSIYFYFPSGMFHTTEDFFFYPRSPVSRCKGHC